MIVLFLSNCLILFYVNNFNEKNVGLRIETSLRKIPQDDREYVSNFFKYVFFTETFGYTIFGNKPLSFTSIKTENTFFLDNNENYMDLIHIFNRHKIKECWEAWSKYSHLFLMKNFTFLCYTLPTHPGFIEIAIVNHENFIKTISENIEDFHNVLGNNLTPNEILAEFIQGKGSVFTKIIRHEGLFGTLLGFGRNNAWEFMYKGGENMDGCYVHCYDEPKNEYDIVKPAFKAIPNSEETMMLKSNYLEQKQQIESIYKDKAFLTLVLIKLTS